MSNLSFSQKSEILKFKSGVPLAKRLWNFITAKGLSVPQKLSDFSKNLVIKNNDFSSGNLKNTWSPKMTSKGLWEPLTKSYEQILNFKNRIFMSYFPLGKRLENIRTENASQPRGNNIDFGSKNMKNTLSPKMTLKSI